MLWLPLIRGVCWSTKSKPVSFWSHSAPNTTPTMKPSKRKRSKTRRMLRKKRRKSLSILNRRARKRTYSSWSKRSKNLQNWTLSILVCSWVLFRPHQGRKSGGTRRTPRRSADARRRKHWRVARTGPTHTMKRRIMRVSATMSMMRCLCAATALWIWSGARLRLAKKWWTLCKPPERAHSAGVSARIREKLSFPCLTVMTHSSGQRCHARRKWKCSASARKSGTRWLASSKWSAWTSSHKASTSMLWTRSDSSISRILARIVASIFALSHYLLLYRI